MSERSLISILVNYCYWAMFIGYAISCWTWHSNKTLRAIPILLLITFVAQIFMRYWAVEYKNNAIISHIFNPIQFLLVLVFLYQNIDNIHLKKKLPYVGIAMFLLSIVNMMYIQDVKTFPSNFLVIANLLLIMGATVLFLEKLDAPSKMNIFKDPVFVIVSAILTFNIFSFLFFLLTNFLLTKNYSTTNLSFILIFANLLYYTLLIIAGIFSLKQSYIQSETSRK